MRVYKITIDKKSCIEEDAADAIASLYTLIQETDDPIIIRSMDMSREEFDKIEEFEGW